ncbi:hypothetical protein [Aneurinibacillus tyrosinisolvens]|uniref:hypothetical protein n=1 Tax=Aneurinibacillus tyrosinisolvens TaxID=1443435 RepID=UPI00063F90DB|nr:hypothetical protein [Aneurinibacillus tyrosinisolvens]
MKEEILMVKIHNALKRDGKDFYEATRGNWKVNQARFKHIQYVAGINDGKVVCAFRPLEWDVIKEGTETGRKRFNGIEAPNEILLKLQESESYLTKKFGSGQAVAYACLSEIE